MESDLRELLHWYKVSQRPLPWRLNSHPYPVLVSEFMLQQTTVAAVVPKFHAWMERFPNFETLASASLDEVLIYWSGLGYYQRARRLHKAAQEIIDLGGVPESYQGLLKLSGFGPYTAAAVASICFAQAHLSIDTNVVRVLYRYYSIPRLAGDAAGHQSLRQSLDSFLRTHHPGEINQALMELGALHCSVKEPSCLLCPLREGCQARVSPGGPTRFPLPSPRKEAKETPGRVLILEHDLTRRILLLKGTSLGLLSDLYQPPILFVEEATVNVTAASVLSLWERVTAYPSLNRWTLSYAISGRKLRLECRHWRLGGRHLASCLESLEREGLEYQWWDSLPTEARAQSGKSIAVSTLTRKVLQRWQESRVNAHPPGCS